MMLAAIGMLFASEQTVVISVEGMTCPLCTTAIKKSLKKTNGVIKAKVSLSKRSAKVIYDDDIATHKDLLKAIEETGYKGKIKKDDQ